MSAPAATPSTFFLDSSAAVKAYINEQGTTWMQALSASDTNHVLAVAHIGLVEMAAVRWPNFFGHFLSVSYGVVS